MKTLIKQNTSKDRHKQNILLTTGWNDFNGFPNERHYGVKNFIICHIFVRYSTGTSFFYSYLYYRYFFSMLSKNILDSSIGEEKVVELW